jgi:hypothetical protein
MRAVIGHGLEPVLNVFTQYLFATIDLAVQAFLFDVNAPKKMRILLGQ